MLYSFKNVWISNRNCSRSQYLIVWGFFKTENHSWHLFFSWQSARPRKQKKKWRQASLLVNLLLSFLKIKKLGSFFQELHNFSICKLDSHGSSIYLAIQDSGGHHSSLILCRRIFRRAWRTWLIQFIKVRQTKFLFCSSSFYLFWMYLKLPMFYIWKASRERTPRICSLFPLQT